jgi:hypothetical protein
LQEFGVFAVWPTRPETVSTGKAAARHLNNFKVRMAAMVSWGQPIARRFQL